jgi:hypothetical protein
MYIYINPYLFLFSPSSLWKDGRILASCKGYIYVYVYTFINLYMLISDLCIYTSPSSLWKDGRILANCKGYSFYLYVFIFTYACVYACIHKYIFLLCAFQSHNCLKRIIFICICTYIHICIYMYTQILIYIGILYPLCLPPFAVMWVHLRYIHIYSKSVWRMYLNLYRVIIVLITLYATEEQPNMWIVDKMYLYICVFTKYKFTHVFH